MKTLQSESGFTLIEAIVAMAILSIGILVLYTMQITAIKGNSKANNMTRATVSANDAVEQLMQLGFDDSVFDDTSTTSPHSNLDADAPTLLLPQPISSITWDVTDWSTDGDDNDNNNGADDPGEDGMKQVDVTVNYTVGVVAKQVNVQFMKIGLL